MDATSPVLNRLAPWNRLTTRSKKVLQFSAAMASLGETTVRPIHILIGISREKYGVGGTILKDLGMPFDVLAKKFGLDDFAVRSQMRKMMKVCQQCKGTGFEDSSWTASCKKFCAHCFGDGVDADDNEASISNESLTVLNTAGDEAKSLDHNYIGTEHLLLAAILNEAVVNTIEFFGATAKEVRDKVFVIIDVGAEVPFVDKPVGEFANKVKEKLRRNKHKGDWKGLEIPMLRDELGKELQELDRYKPEKDARS